MVGTLVNGEITAAASMTLKEDLIHWQQLMEITKENLNSQEVVGASTLVAFLLAWVFATQRTVTLLKFDTIPPNLLLAMLLALDGKM
jgi:hypothetical protein